MEVIFASSKNEKYLGFENHKNTPLYIFKPIRIIRRQIYRVLRDLIQPPSGTYMPTTTLQLGGCLVFAWTLLMKGNHKFLVQIILFWDASHLMIFPTKSNIIEMLSMHSRHWHL